MASRLITVSEYLKLKESSLGERIRFFREEISKLNTEQDFSTRALSKRMGMTAQSITAVERGDSRNPSYQLIYRLSKELNISLDYLSDEFYQGEIKLFTIGMPENNDSISARQSSEIDPSLDSNFHFGCYVYQVFRDGRMRFLYNKETKRTIDYQTFIVTLSRFIAEIELHSGNEDLLHLNNASISPLNHAIELFKASLNNPESFPFLPKKIWNQRYNEFLNEHIKLKEEREEDEQ